MNDKEIDAISININSDLNNYYQETSSYDIRDYNSSSSEERTISYNIFKPPNTSQRYEVLSLSGRTENNKWLVKNADLQPVSHSVSNEFSDIEARNHSTGKNIFVNKFSSPGAETSAEISLNKESAEYSVYNSTNYKNLLARKNLNEWTSETSSIESTIPSLHKINKNPKYSISQEYVFNGESSATQSFIDEIDYDNYFISHQIPQSDKQYSWIKNSLSKQNIFEPQYRNYENQIIIDNIKIYDVKKIDNSNLIAVYLKNNKIYIGYLAIKKAGRERSISFISENYINSTDFGAPVLSLLSNKNGIIKGIIASTWISDELTEYPIFCPFQLINGQFIFGEIQKNLTNEFLTKQHTYFVNLSELDYSIQRLEDDYFCMANSASVFIGKVDDLLIISTSNSQPYVGENPNIFPVTNGKFIFSYSSDEQKYSLVEYNTSSLTFNISTNIQSYNPPLKHAKYSYLGKDSSKNSYYTLIYKNGNINVDLLKIDSQYTSSILDTVSVGISYNDNIHFINNCNLENSIINYNTTFTNNNFKSIYLINSSVSGNAKLTAGIIDIDIISQSLSLSSTTQILNSSSYDLSLVNCLNDDLKSLDTFFFYNNNNKTIFEHCAISKDQFFTYFVDRQTFDNNLEFLWRKELYKNYSVYNTETPEQEEEYFFSYKTQLLDPIIEFCGTNLSVIKDYNFETNTISLLNLTDGIRLREYLTNLNGFYGFSSWRQINNSRNWININLRKQNTYFSKNKSFVEPVLTILHPLKAKIKEGNSYFEFEDDYLNKHTYFSNYEYLETLEKNIFFSALNNKTKYENFASHHADDYEYISLTEDLYPKKKFFSITRKRENYEKQNNNTHNDSINNSNEYWRDQALKRSKQLNNSYNNLDYENQNIVNDNEYIKTKSIFPNIIKDTNLTKSWIGTNTKNLYSIWPMDNYFIYNNKSYNIFEYETLFSGTSSIEGISNNVSSAYYNVELDSQRVIGDLAYPGYIEERKLTYFIPPNLFGIKSVPRTQFIFNPFSISENFEPYGWLSRTYEISNKYPWYNSYEDYIEELRIAGQNYAILPEYNISENIKTYLNKGSDYINKNFLSLKGENITSSAIEVITTTKLFSRDVNSDFENNLARDISEFTTSRKYNRLIAQNIDLKNDSVLTSDYKLSENIVKDAVLDNYDLDRSTSLKINNISNESSLYSIIDNINDQLSQSSVFSPNLTTSSFGISTWFKLSKDSFQNKKPAGLFTFINTQDPKIYDPISLGVILNCSGSNIGDGTLLDTDIVVYNNGPHDSGVEKKNIIKFYNNSSTTLSTNQFPSSKILLDDNWHHLFVQYNKPTSYNTNYQIAQKQESSILFPNGDQEYGYLKNSFKTAKNVKNSRKNILLRKEGNDYIIASINIFGKNDDVSKISDQKNVGINIFKLSGNKYTLLDSKIIPFRYASYNLNTVYLNDEITNYSVEDYTFLDAEYLGNYNSKDIFILSVTYRGTGTSNEEYTAGKFWSIYTDYMFGSFDTALEITQFNQFNDNLGDQLDYNRSSPGFYDKFPTYFSIKALEYTDKSNKLIINYNTYNKNGFKHTSRLTSCDIDYANLQLTNKNVLIERTSSYEITNPVLADKITSIVPVNTGLNNNYPSSSFLELYNTGSYLTNRLFEIYHHNTGSIERKSDYSDVTLLDSKMYFCFSSGSNDYLIANILYPTENFNHLVLYQFDKNNSSLNKVTDLSYSPTLQNNNFPNVITSSQIDDLYISDNKLILPVGDHLSSSLNLYSISTTSINFITSAPFTSDIKIVDTNFISTLNKPYNFNFDHSSSFNVPFTYFDTSSLHSILTTIKVDSNVGSGAEINVFLDGVQKYGIQYNSTGTVTNKDYILDNQPYYEIGDQNKSNNNLNKFILGYTQNTQFLTNSIGFDGEIDEVTLWNGSYTTESILKIYNNGVVTNPNTLSKLFNDNKSIYFSEPTGNIFSWYRIGNPQLSTIKQQEQYTYNNNFFEKYGSLDPISFYKENDNIITHYDRINNDLTSSIKKISITVNGISKLLPYNGFYPQQRTAQIGKLFLNSIGNFDQFSKDNQNLSISDSDNATKNGGMYKINNESIVQSFLQPFMSPGLLFNSIKSGIAVDWPVYIDNTVSITSSIFNHKPTYYKTSSAGIDLNRDGIKYVISKDSNTSLIRIPFEALIDINNFPKKENSEKSDIIYLHNPTIYSLSSSDTSLNNVYPYFIWKGTKNNSDYELAINNFVAEVPRFFLENKGLTTFISKPSKDLLPTISGTLYVMDINIYKDQDFDMIIAANNSSKGKYFGPPVNYVGDNQNQVSASIKDPAYAPYVPPYFYGKNVLRLKYLANSYTTTIKEIISKLEVEEITTELDNLFISSNGSLNSTSYKDKMTLASSIVYNKTIIDPTVTIKEGESSRQLSNNVSDNEQNRRWIISTKWETPVFNFNDQKSNNYPLKSEDSFTSSELNRYNSQTIQTGRVEIKPIASTGIWSGYSKNYDSGIKLSISNPFKESQFTSSLANLCGFETVEKKIGQIANSKIIDEAIILIPYYEKQQEINTEDKFIFFDLNKENFKKAYDYYLSNINNESSPNTLVDLIRKMEKYELPLHLNFLQKAKNNNFNDYNPFAMYVFEFSRELDKEDLADIWQGILPKAGTIMKKDSVTIEHKFGEEELITSISDSENLKWLIFKVKKKAEKFYSDLTNYEDERFKLLKVEKDLMNVGYNWPYDFCSLVELANVNIQFQFYNEKKYKE